jgi:hypothetical protein
MRADKGSRQASISRRHLLTAAAGAGATAATAYVAGTAVGPVAITSAPSAGGTSADAGGPVVVHVRDAASGAMDVFSGTERIQVRDRDLAARIARAAAADPTDRSL